MACLVKHASGIYYAQFYDAARRPRWKRFTLRTRNRRTAERLLAKLEADYLLGSYDPWAPVKEAADEASEGLDVLGLAYDAYLASRAHLRPETLRTYREVMGAFVHHVGRDFPVTQLRTRHVLAWLDTTHAGDVTRRKYVTHLGYLFRWLVARGAMSEDLSKGITLPRLAEQAPKAMTDEMVEVFLQTARRKVRQDFGWLADLVEANVELGLRRGELLALRPDHVDLKGRILRVTNGDGFATKSGKERALPLSTTARRALERRLAEGRAFVFEAPTGLHTPTSLSHAFRKVRIRAGLPEWVTLHSTRHTALTRLAEQGVPVEVIRQFAGHHSITVTERYTRMRPDVVFDHVLKAFG